MAMGAHGEKSTSKEGLAITIESGKGCPMFFEQVHLNLGSTWSAKTVITWAAGCAPPFEGCWKDLVGIRAWFVLPKQILSPKAKGEDATREDANEVASDIEWFLRDYIKRMRGEADPGTRLAVQTVLTTSGDYENLCETVRDIKKKSHETGEGQPVMKSPRKRMYIVDIAPFCLASGNSRKKIERAIVGKETKSGSEPKKTKEAIKDLLSAGFDLGPDYANTMVTWVGPGNTHDSQDQYTSARLMSENLERFFRQTLSAMGVLPLAWSTTRTLFPQMGNWYNSGIFVTSARSAGQHHYMALTAILSTILPLDIDAPREGEGHPNFNPNAAAKKTQMPSKGRVKLCLNSGWKKRVGGTIGGWYKALVNADNENRGMGDMSRGLVRETEMDRSEIFFPHTRKYGDELHGARKGQRGGGHLCRQRACENPLALSRKCCARARPAKAAKGT